MHFNVWRSCTTSWDDDACQDKHAKLFPKLKMIFGVQVTTALVVAGVSCGGSVGVVSLSNGGFLGVIAGLMLFSPHTAQGRVRKSITTGANMKLPRRKRVLRRRRGPWQHFFTSFRQPKAAITMQFNQCHEVIDKCSDEEPEAYSLCSITIIRI